MKKSHNIIITNIALKVLEVLVVLLLTLLIEWFYFGFNNFDFYIPYESYNDGVTGIGDIKMQLTDRADAFGWPFHENTMQYAARYRGLYLIFIHIVGLVTSNPIVIQGIFLVAIPTMNVFVAYIVFRLLKFRRWNAYLLSLAFGFCPYVQARLGGHQALAAVEIIPIAILICIWIYERKEFAKPGLAWFKNKYNYITLILTWMIANNGMVYYPFFSCFIILVTGVCVLLETKKISSILPSITIISQIVGWLIIGFIPTIIGIIKGAGNVATAGATRGAIRATYYGLDIKSMLLSPNGFGFPAVLNKYDGLIFTGNEKDASYIGFIAILGFFLLLFMLFINKEVGKNITLNKLTFLSKLNIAIILLATLNGFGVIIAGFMPYISCYNRISPYIVFVSLFAVGIVIEYVCNRYMHSRPKKLCFTFLIILLLCYGILEAQNSYFYIDKGSMDVKRVEATQDKHFFATIDNKIKKNDMVFMLPYMKNIENGPINDLYDYDHFKAFIFSNKARLSYGAINGSRNDIWYYKVSQLKSTDMVTELKKKDFAGIYINLLGYEKEDRNTIKRDFSQATGDTKPIEIENEKLFFLIK